MRLWENGSPSCGTFYCSYKSRKFYFQKDATRIQANDKEDTKTPEEIGQAVQVVLDAAKKLGPENVATYIFTANPSARQVFTKEQEEILAAYLLKASKIHYGLTTINTRKLAYQYAVRLQLNCSQQWNTREMTGRDWLLGFRDRHPTLLLRCPEATSLGRASGFHKFTFNAMRCPKKESGCDRQVWLDDVENFIEAMKHFIRYSKGFSDNPVLLLRDNHESIGVITEAKWSGVHLLTFPPHCSHRAVNEKNSIFEETSTVEEYNLDKKANRCSTPLCSLNLSMISPEDVVPFPKAAPRRMTAGKRIKERTRILTDSNEIKNIEHVENE
ncbi:hypothetical protein ILUMI_14782 [Ignelater luminosus]|uniref:HTH CENPB-type domain-containing protein n=1 Tax=Ignelater luminosus TaxID=2038154 RepID=A0A8K0GA57_IGNLU|nr:hypothetical protein ILUMI_14782 [Ignelater luminosus]